MLSGKGFGKVINLSGGIKAWKGEKAILGEEKGLEFFSGLESHEQILIIACGLEMGLEEFYVSMKEAAKSDGVKKLFEKLSMIEVRHMERVFQEYVRISSKKISLEEFTSGMVIPAAEGGMSTEEYIEYFGTGKDSPEGAVELAMSIEAQALDLYSRASERTDQGESREFLLQMADEERAHLLQLGHLMDSIIEERG